MKVVGYYRYSSDNQRSESIDAQKRAIDDFCVKNGHILVRSYIDEALSATTDDRPCFLRMIEDSKSKEFEAVIVHKLDRFARNREDSAIYKYKLKKNGVRVVSVIERFDDSPESIILESVIEGINEYYSRNLAREVKKGLKENALKSLWCGGIPPLGYDVDKQSRKLVINNYEAGAVKIIFEMFANCESYQTIISRLNELGYKTKARLDKFGKNSLHEILKNKKYIGVFEFGKITKKPSYDEGIKNHYVETKNCISIENGCPAIIDHQLWDKVQCRMRKNKHSIKANVLYVLRSKMVCGKCGSSYIGSSTRSHGKMDYYYVCSGKKNKKTICDNRNVKKEVIEQLIIEEIKKIVLSDQKIKDILKQVQLHNKEAMLFNTQKELLDCEKQINDFLLKLERVKQMFMNGVISITELKEKSTELENRISYFREQLRLKGLSAFLNQNF